MIAAYLILVATDPTLTESLVRLNLSTLAIQNKAIYLIEDIFSLGLLIYRFTEHGQPRPTT